MSGSNSHFRGVENLPPYAEDDVVITGISGRFPLADNLQELKDNLFSKRNCVVCAEDRWPTGLPGLPGNFIGTIKSLDKFDFLFFGLKFPYVSLDDPQIRLLYEACHEAIIDSGHDIKELSGKDIGVFVGQSASDPIFLERVSNKNYGDEIPFGYLSAMASNKLAFRYDVRAPSCTLDTGCSSSAAALEEAFRRMKDGTIDAALVGAAAVCLDPKGSKMYSDVKMLSPTGETCAYSENANGFAVADAISMLFVQKKKDARRIYAKIHNIANIAAAQQPEGVYFPSLEDQINLFRHTYDLIGMDPSLVDYIEGNATGKREADQTEVNSISEFFCKDRNTPLLIGSVKTNIGHTKASSALCSIAKVIIAFETGALPPNIHYSRPNPESSTLAEGKVKVVTETTPYDRPLAAINNYGFGGAIAHMILERNATESGPMEDRHMHNIPKLVMYHSTTKEALSNMFNYFHENPMPDEFFALLNKSAYASTFSPYRGFTILKKDSPPIMFIEHFNRVKRPIWYLLTGIGCSQWLGMGLELMEIKVFAESLRRSAKVLDPFGIDLLELLNPKNVTQEKRLTETLVRTTAFQIALIDLLKALCLEPDGIIGHSIGELACSYADGCCTAEQTILLGYHIAVSVEKANLPPGAMAVVDLSWEEAKNRCPEGIHPACHDTEDCVTISGPAKAIKRFVEELKKESISASVIDTNGCAFHCKIIREATDKLRSTLKEVYTSVRPRSKRWLSTSYSEQESSEPRSSVADADYYCHNLESEVHLKEALSRVPSDAIIIDIGPHFLLSPTVAKAVGGEASYVGIPERNENSVVSLLTSIGMMYNLGLNPQVENLYEPVSYPVPRGTPMIAPLIQWDHSHSFYVPKYEDINLGQTRFPVRINGAEKFILDHCIEGRALYPAAGYVYLAWRGFSAAISKPMNSFPVCVENLKIFRATILRNSAYDSGKEKEFVVRTLHKSGDFEITEGGSIVATGKIYIPKTTVFDDSSYHYEQSESSLIISGPEMYNELKISGYEYGPAFQGLLEVNMEGSQGLVKWNDQWISFLDSLLLFFGIINENDDFKLPTGALSFKINPIVHNAFVSKMKETGMKGIPVKYDVHIRKCATPGIEIRDLKLDVAPKRPTYQNAPVLEEYSFVPYYETDAIFGTENTAKCQSYIEVCNYLAMQIVRNMNIDGKLQTIFEELHFDENICDQELIFNEDEYSVLMKSLRDILEISTSQTNSSMVEMLCQSISDVLVEDMLFKSMISEKPMRSILDVTIENCTGKMSIVEWCHNKPLMLTAFQKRMEISIATKTSCILIHSQAEVVDPESLKEKGIQVEHAESSNDIPSNLQGSCHLGVTCYMAESTDSLKTRIRNLASLTKKEGFILLIHKHELIPAEQLMYTLSKLPFTLHSEVEIENLFRDEKLAVVSKKSSSFGMNAYLLRKVPEKSQLREDCIVKVLDGEYDQWVENLKKALSTVQEKGSSRLVLLVAQDIISNGIIGMANCLRQEPGGHNIRCIFTDTSAPPFDLTNSFYSNVFENDLFMNVYINGTWGSFRHTTLPSDIPQALSNCAAIECTKLGDLSSLQWWENPDKTIVEDHDVNEFYHVYYSSLNFKDVMIATGKIADITSKAYGRKKTSSCLGLEFSGRDKNGRRVMAVVVSGSLCNTYVQKPLFVTEIPCHWTMEEAATVPVVYSTCYYALIMRGELQHGESILIHSGTGGVGQAAIRIALSMDCEIFVTVGTPEKKDFLMKLFPQLKLENVGCSRNTTFEELIMRQTKGDGVDVVLNSLADDKFQASIRCLGNHGRFLEIGKYDLQMNNSLGLQAFQRGISFHSCQMDMYSYGSQKSEKLFSIIKGLLGDGIRRGVVQPLNSTVFSSDEAEKAFRYMGSGKHVGKVLIKMREEETTRDVVPSALMVNSYRKLTLCGNKSYIVIGGLGGFGIELAKWLVQKGAGTVILTSRYGARTQYHHLCLKRWEASGARVVISTLDVSKRDEAQKLLEETSTMYGSIGGIFNSAVVLKDAFIENQTPEAFEEVCAPKALATKHLDELTRLMCPELDIFVCFSSISCGKGNAGQSNYGYANSVMERICEKRKQDGLHGLAIQWGIIGDVGLVHRHMGDDAMIGGVMAQKIKSCLQTLEQVLLQDKPVVSSFVTADKSKMKSVSEDALTNLAILFGFKNIEEMDKHRTFGEMGMDSMAGVEMRHMLQSTYDIALTLQEIQDMKLGDLIRIIEDLENKNKGSVKSSAQITESINITDGQKISLAREAVVAVNKITDGVPVFVIPGNDFSHEKYKHIYEGISHPVFVVQCTLDTPITTLKDMALWFLEEIQKVCPETPVHLVSISTSGILALEMTLLSEKLKGQQANIISLTILNGSLELMKIHSTRDQEKSKNVAIDESSDLCEFLSAFSDSDLTQMKKQLEEQISLEYRMNTISSRITSSDKSSFLAAAEFHMRKQNLMRFGIPGEKTEMNIMAIEPAEEVLPNDVATIKSFLAQMSDGRITIHRIVGNNEFLVGKSSADEIASLLNKLYE